MRTYNCYRLADFETHVAARTAAHMVSAPIIAPPKWQGVDVSGKIDMQTREILNHTMHLVLADNHPIEEIQEAIRPDLPWCDDHFEERVSGAPMNPGTEWANWRLGAGAKKFLNVDGLFNHNYMERMWPRFAHRNSVHGPTETAKEWWDHSGEVSSKYDDLPNQEREHLEYAMRQPMHGIRGPYGDLKSVVALLQENPMARQAYLPMFFPEDTGTHDRSPCSLGWHFIMRGGNLHMVYYMRSCDFINHWRNDVYMAIRLLMWMLDALRSGDAAFWDNVGLGTLTMHTTSLHVFRGQEHLLKDMI